MFTLSELSRKNLGEAHPLLQKVVKQFQLENPDFRFQVNDGSRNREQQEEAFKNKRSRAHFGQSAHNWTPALALDIYPLPVQFNDLKPYRVLAAAMKQAALHAGVAIVWGGDWKSIKDYPHYELRDWRALAKTVKPYGGE